jgi:hypothetical protein
MHIMNHNGQKKWIMIPIKKWSANTKMQKDIGKKFKGDNNFGKK